MFYLVGINLVHDIDMFHHIAKMCIHNTFHVLQSHALIASFMRIKNGVHVCILLYFQLCIQKIQTIKMKIWNHIKQSYNNFKKLESVVLIILWAQFFLFQHRNFITCFFTKFFAIFPHWRNPKMLERMYALDVFGQF